LKFYFYFLIYFLIFSGRFGLWLDRDFYNGSSSKSETFGNQCLSNKQDFICKGLEVWGFQEFKA